MKVSHNHGHFVLYNISSNHFGKVAALLEQHIDEFALAESRDQGKPVSLAKNMDMTRAVVNLRAFAEAWQSHVGSSSEVRWYERRKKTYCML